MMPPDQQKDFEDLEASQLYCPACKRAMPVRKRLLLVLLDKEIFSYVCARCGSEVGKKEQPWRRPAQWPRI
jgi:C4-type Zn-finger protein